VLDAEGHKLSKAARAGPIDPADPAPALRRALAFLRQPLPDIVTSVDGLLTHALGGFDPAMLPHCSGSSVA
jgi:glutamyl-Q tRNA(Asp) synthetase